MKILYEVLLYLADCQSLLQQTTLSFAPLFLRQRLLRSINHKQMKNIRLNTMPFAKNHSIDMMQIFYTKHNHQSTSNSIPMDHGDASLTFVSSLL